MKRTISDIRRDLESVYEMLLDMLHSNHFVGFEEKTFEVICALLDRILQDLTEAETDSKGADTKKEEYSHIF